MLGPTVASEHVAGIGSPCVMVNGLAGEPEEFFRSDDRFTDCCLVEFSVTLLPPVNFRLIITPHVKKKLCSSFEND